MKAETLMVDGSIEADLTAHAGHRDMEERCKTRVGEAKDVFTAFKEYIIIYNTFMKVYPSPCSFGLLHLASFYFLNAVSESP